MRRKTIKRTPAPRPPEDQFDTPRENAMDRRPPYFEGPSVSERGLENISESSEASFLVELLLLLPRPHARIVLHGMMGRLDAVEREALRTKLFVHFTKWGKGR